MSDYNSDGKSWVGTISAIIMFKISQATKSDLMFILTVISAAVTIGYTSYKWYLLYKKKNIPESID